MRKHRTPSASSKQPEPTRIIRQQNYTAREATRISKKLSNGGGSSLHDRAESSRCCHGTGIPRILVGMMGFQKG